MARLRRIGFQRSRQIALRHLHVANLVIRHRQFALQVGAVRLLRQESLERFPALVAPPRERSEFRRA